MKIYDQEKNDGLEEILKSHMLVLLSHTQDLKKMLST